MWLWENEAGGQVGPNSALHTGPALKQLSAVMLKGSFTSVLFGGGVGWGGGGWGSPPLSYLHLNYLRFSFPAEHIQQGTFPAALSTIKEELTYKHLQYEVMHKTQGESGFRVSIHAIIYYEYVNVRDHYKTSRPS